MPGEDFDGEARILFDGVSQGGNDGLVSLCLDEADEIHEWESNPLFAPDPKICEEKGCWLGTRIR